MLVQDLLRGLRGRHFASDVNTATVPILHPPLTRKLPVTCTHRIRVNTEASCQLARARQPLARLQVAAQYRELHLCHELAVNWNLTRRRKPEPQPRTPYRYER